jgi:mannosyl-3-phosphoglycerate phosphatase
MKLRAVLTDLDGTLLEPDGSLCSEAAATLRVLRERGVAVVPLTSKTASEVRHLLDQLDLPGPAGFENGAGVVDRLGATRLNPVALPMESLRIAAARLRRETSVPLQTLDELSDEDLGALVGLAGDELARLRERRATLPLLVDEAWDEALRRAAPPETMLVRGDRFLHFQGRHDKADLVGELLGTSPGEGVVVILGDAPNDLELLRSGDLAVIVPSATGAHPVLRKALPDAVIAPAPHGRGWAGALRQLLEGEGS